MRTWIRGVFIAVGLALTPSVLPAGAAVPFVVTASSGPFAGAHVVATVTRRIGTRTVALPAALVPALKPGDVVDVDFPDYRQPPNRVRYHVNVAFITESAPQHWLFSRSGPADRLFGFQPPRGKRPKPGVRPGTIHFTYGVGSARGIPIFFIIPEDGKTRGVDGVRDYVEAHPSDFVAMSQSTNAAVDQYSFLRDFLTTLGSGSIDPAGDRARIKTLAQSVGVNPASIDACYAAGSTAAEIDSCVQQAVDAVVYQTNFSAPTEGQFLGGIASAASPIALAPYLASLLTVWRIFVHTGHQEYEYLPTTLALARRSDTPRDELLMGPKVPTLRPPGPYSDVLFFTIGDPKAAEAPPAIVNAAPATGVCESAERFSVPLAFDHTSTFLHDAALVVAPDGRPAYRISLDPGSLAAPVVERSRFKPASDGGYTVSLAGEFGFDPIAQPIARAVRIAFPSDAPWTIAPGDHRQPISGETLDLIATSPTAPCLSRAELQMGDAPPIALSVTRLDARRVRLQGSLTGVPAGPATLRFDEDDSARGRTAGTTVPLTIAAPPAHVDAHAVAALGDAEISLRGAGLERVRAIRIAGVEYRKAPDATAIAACFVGPPLAGSGLTAGAEISAQLTRNDGAGGEVFPLTLGPPRPLLHAPTLTGSGPYLSTQAVHVDVRSDAGPLPDIFSVRIRQAPPEPGTCDGVVSDPAAVTLPARDVHLRGPSEAAIDFAPEALGDRAFGSIQLRIVDRATGDPSNWVTLPGVFARAPRVSAIACPPDPSMPCRLYGSALRTIDAVAPAGGTFEAPDFDCPSSPKGVRCVVVVHAEHYVVRLVDGGLTESLPDTVLGPAPP